MTTPEQWLADLAGASVEDVVIREQPGGGKSYSLGPGSLDAIKTIGQAEGVVHSAANQHPDKDSRLSLSDPEQPVCIGCGRYPEEIPAYVYWANAEGVETPREYVLQEEGTLNGDNGHFACDDCYLAMGSPTAPGRWRAP